MLRDDDIASNLNVNPHQRILFSAQKLYILEDPALSMGDATVQAIQRYLANRIMKA